MAVADPTQCEELARSLEMAAGALDSLNRSLSSQLGAAGWQCPAADSFRAAYSQTAASIADQADRLRAAAGSARVLADRLAEELADIRAIEADVHAWYSAHPVPALAGAAAPWPDHDLPFPGDPQWRQVQQAFAAAGIHVGLTGVTLPAAVAWHPDVVQLVAGTPTNPAAPGAPAGAPSSPVATSASVAGGVVAGPVPPSTQTTETVLGMPVTPSEKWIIDHEDAGYSTTAWNPIDTTTGHAFGLGQLTDATRQRYLGAEWQTTDPALQLQAMRDYIHDRYGTADAAVAFWKLHGWY